MRCSRCHSFRPSRGKVELEDDGLKHLKLVNELLAPRDERLGWCAPPVAQKPRKYQHAAHHANREDQEKRRKHLRNVYVSGIHTNNKKRRELLRRDEWR